MITVNNVSMKYRMTFSRIKSLKEYVVSMLTGKLQYEDFWALQNISFTVDKGEVVGIIGHNGAGKSTLLKIISGILKPTEGNIDLGGNVVPMLELGSGFDLDLSGRENIFLNGAILGYGEDFLKSKEEEIIAFSELDKFIDIPIRNYSSGMTMRIAFSIATVVNPQILIVDEILGVGDDNFLQKSKEKMLELMSSGTTVLFVSHDIVQIEEMCDRVVWIEHGRLMKLGKAKEICEEYRGFNKDARGIL